MNQSQSIFIFLIIFFKTLSYAYSSEDIQVYATLVPTQLSTALSSVEVIEEEEILNSGAHDLGELLSMKSSYSVSRNGGIGSVSSIMVRGGSSEYSIVIIDGIKQVDGTKGAGGFNPQNIDISTIKRIEIIKDAAGVLYGDGALSGIIKITTKENINTGHIKLLKESHRSHGVELGLSKSIKKLSFNIFGKHYKSDGISSYNERRILGPAEKDGFTKKLLKTNLSYNFNKNHKLTLFGDISLSNCKTDGYLQDTVQGQILFTQNKMGSKYQGSFLDGIIKSNFSLNQTKTKRKYFSQASNINYESRDIQFMNMNNIFLNEVHTLYTGVELQTVDYIDNADSIYQQRYQESIFAGDQMRYKNMFFNLGGRATWIENNSGHRSFKVGAGIEVLDGFVIKTNISNAYKTPTLFQLHSEKWGNKELNQTKSLSSSIMVLAKLNNLQLGISYFDNRYTNEISYDYSSQKYFNIGKSQVAGHEVNIIIHQLFRTKWSIDYTKILARDLINNKYLTNRAKTKLILSQEVSVSKSTKLLINNTYFGRRNAYNGQTMSGHVLHDLAVLYKYNIFQENKNNIQVRFNIKNIFDREYEEVFGYGTYGRTFSLSLRQPFSL